MALTFPSSPTNGQTHAASNGSTYTWNGVSWRLTSPSGYSGTPGATGATGPAGSGGGGGITALTAGTGISLSSSTGNVTISATSTPASVPIVNSLPATGDYTGQVVMYNSKLYIWNGTQWVEVTATVTLPDTPEAIAIVDNLPEPATDGTVVLLRSDGQLYKRVSGSWVVITQTLANPGITVVTSLPGSATEGDVVFNKTDGYLYQYVSGSWVQVAVQVNTSATVADASITTAKFAAGIRPVEIVSSLPTTGNFVGRIVFLTTDNKLYRYNGTSFVATVPAVDITGQLTDAQIADIAAAKLTGTITGTQITDGAISTAKLAAGSITTAKLAAGAVTADTIAANAITAAKISAGSVTTSALAAGAVTAATIAADTITAGQIAAGAIGASEIAANAITSDKIYANAITSDKIVANAITVDKIATNAITADKIAANSIIAGKIAAGVIGAAELSAGAVTADKIAANAITAGKISAGAIGTTQLAAGAVTASTIAAGAITSSAIAADAIVAGKIAAGTIGATEISSGAITSSKIAAGAVTATSIAAGTITADRIATGTITADRLAAGTITADKIAAGTITVDKLSSSSGTFNGVSFSLGAGSSIAGYTAGGAFSANSGAVFGLIVSNGLGPGLGVGVAGTSYAAGFYNSTSTSYTSHRTAVELGYPTQAGVFTNVTAGRWIQLATASYAFSTSGGASGAFTGAHDALIPNNEQQPVPGDIVIDVSVYAKPNVYDSLCVNTLSTQPNQKGAIGVVAEAAAEGHIPAALMKQVPISGGKYEAILDPVYTDIGNYKMYVVNALGEGLMNVCGEGGNLEVGDLIVTSSIPGKGMKQADDIVRSYTIAKVREAATFSSATDGKQVAVVYLAG